MILEGVNAVWLLPTSRQTDAIRHAGAQRPRSKRRGHPCDVDACWRGVGMTKKARWRGFRRSTAHFPDLADLRTQEALSTCSRCSSRIRTFWQRWASSDGRRTTPNRRGVQRGDHPTLSADVDNHAAALYHESCTIMDSSRLHRVKQVVATALFGWSAALRSVPTRHFFG